MKRAYDNGYVDTMRNDYVVSDFTDIYRTKMMYLPPIHKQYFLTKLFKIKKLPQPISVENVMGYGHYEHWDSLDDAEEKRYVQ